MCEEGEARRNWLFWSTDVADAHKSTNKFYETNLMTFRPYVMCHFFQSLSSDVVIFVVPSERKKKIIG